MGLGGMHYWAAFLVFAVLAAILWRIVAGVRKAIKKKRLTPPA